MWFLSEKQTSYFIDLVKKLPPQGVLNYSDMFEQRFMEMYVDKRFQIEFIFTPIIFLSLVYGGYAVITLKDGKTTITASNLDQIPKIGVMDLYEFKYLSRPAQVSMAELKRLFDVLGLNPVLLDNPNDRETGVAQLLAKAQEMSNSAVMAANKLNNGFDLWGEPLVSSTDLSRLRDACNAVRNEFSNYSAKFNTPAKLNNFSLSMEQVDKLEEQIKLAMLIPQYMDFKNGCGDVVSYIQNIEYIDLGEAFKAEIEQAKFILRPMAGKRLMDVFLDGNSKLTVTSAPNISEEEYKKLEAMCRDFAYDTFVELKDKQIQTKKESYNKYMYALQLRTEAAEHIGIENIRRSRLAKLEREKSAIEAEYKKGSQVYPDFRMMIMIRLEA